MEEVNLYQLAESVIEDLQLKAQKKDVSLVLKGEDALLRGNPVLLHSLVYNLCDNAIIYNKEHGSVEVTVANLPQEISLTVADTGIGIASDEQERIFERFYRVDKSRSKVVGGTGLGLSIVKKALAFHNGRLNLSSSIGKGTIMAVLFKK